MLTRVIAVWLMLASVAMAGTINSQPTIPGPLRATDATAVGRAGAAAAYKMTVRQLAGFQCWSSAAGKQCAQAMDTMNLVGGSVGLVGGKPTVTVTTPDYRIGQDFLSIAAAVSYLGSTPATVYVPADTTVSADLSIPVTLELVPLNGAKINHGSYTVTYAGSTARWPLAQVLNGTGAVSGFKESRPEWFGDVTATGAIPKAVAATEVGGVVILSGSDYVEAGITAKSGVHFVSHHATVTLQSNASENGQLFDFLNKTDSGILGYITLEGNKANQIYVDDQHGQMGISIKHNARNLTFGTVIANNFSQDGFYCGEGSNDPSGPFYPTNIRADKIICTGNVRNGASITNVDGLHVGTLIGIGSTGGLPGLGIDFEANVSTDKLSDIHIGYLGAWDNNSYGVGFPQGAHTYLPLEMDITIDRLVSHHNNYAGIVMWKSRNITIHSADVHHNAGHGLLITEDTTDLRIKGDFHHNALSGLYAHLDSDGEHNQTISSGRWDFSGSKFYNNGQGPTTNGFNDGVWLSSDSSALPLVNVNLKGCTFYDNQAIKTQRVGIASLLNCDNIEVDGEFEGNGAGDYTIDSTVNLRDKLVYLARGKISGSFVVGEGGTYDATFGLIPAASTYDNTRTIVVPVAGADEYSVLSITPSAKPWEVSFSYFMEDNAGVPSIRINAHNHSNVNVTMGVITFHYVIQKLWR